MSNKLIDNVNEIKRQKDEYIIPENIKSGITVFGVDGTLEEGIDTSDANAVSSDILSGKTAYVNGEKLTGTIVNNGTINITPTTSQQTIPEGYTSGGTVGAVTSSIDANIIPTNIRAGVSVLGVQGNLEPDKPDQSKTVTPTTSEQVIQADTGYELAQVTVEAVDNTIDENIVAENIKDGVSILGVTGTYEGGSGDVKLFESVEDMNADTDKHEGDLAIVYSQNVSNITEDTEFSTCTFPASVTLPYEVTEEVQGSFRAVDTSETFDAWATLSAESFRFNGWSESGEIRVEYTSSDGITYTRTDGGDGTLDFGVTVKFDNRYEEFDTNYGYFMRARICNFGGLFEYTLDHVNEDIIVPASGFTYSNGTISPINTNLKININNINVFTTAISACEEYAGVSLASNTGMIFCNNDISHIYVYTVNNFSSSTSSLYFDSNNTLYFRLSGNGTINGYDYDVDLDTVTSISLTQTPIQRY